MAAPPIVAIIVELNQPRLGFRLSDAAEPRGVAFRKSNSVKMVCLGIGLQQGVLLHRKLVPFARWF